MKRTIAISFCVLLSAVLPLAGCAGPATQIQAAQISDRSVTGEGTGGATGTVTAEKHAEKASAAEKAVAGSGTAPGAGTAEKPADKTPGAEKKAAAGGGAVPAGAVETPAEKVYVDKKGNFEISATPFGYVKREKKQAGKEPGESGPVPQESVVPLAPAAAASAPAAPPDPQALKAQPAPPVPAPAEKASPEKAGQVSFDFDDADLYAVIRTMADFLKINYIIDPGVSGKVTIHTAGRLKETDLFPIFYQTLEVNGLTAVKEGSLYRIGKLKDAARMPIATRLARERRDIPPEERIIIQIIPLKFISVQEAAKVVTPFISADGTIISEGGSNTLLVVDKGINIFKVLRLVDVLDVSVFERISYRFYNLKNTNAEDASKALGEILSVSGGSKDDVKFIPIKWLNALLIVSLNPDVFTRVDALIEQLDLPRESAQPQIYVYSVKNGMATELGDTLRAIFGKGGEIRKGAGRESVPTNPFAKGYQSDRQTTAPAAGAAAPAAPAAPAVTAPAKPAATSTGSSVTLRGDIKITDDPIRNALIIEAIPADYQIVERILGRLDVLPRQVLIEVVIAEISLGQGTELGIEWTFKKDNWIDSGSLSASVGASGLQYAIGLSQKWQAALHALARDSKVNILSSPSVLASDNKIARIDVTTEVPIPSTNYTYTTSGSNVLETKVEYRNTGVILDVTPHINEHGLVTMDVSQEVSNVGELLKVAGKDYYSFNKRQVKTSLTVKHNQSIVIGGLISNTKSDAASGVPWLVKVPFLRWLFGTETSNASKSELILMITPRVITSLDDVDAVSEEFKKKIGTAMSFFK
ncbi:MAG: type II secretion system secretin GspD [Syntrophales bacterium]